MATISGENISGANTIEGNVISRNGTNGVSLLGNLGGGSPLLQISENFIGTDTTGLTIYESQTGESFGNGLSGVLLELNAAPSLTAVTVTVSGNVISGNGLNGITVEAIAATRATANVAIEDNLIGTDMSGANVARARPITSSVRKRARRHPAQRRIRCHDRGSRRGEWRGER